MPGLAGLVPPVVATGEPGGWEISPLSLDVLSCDAEVIPVLTDSFGRALDVGDTQYPFPPKIRRAVEVRDRHCTFPGCSAKPAWCHVHHLVPFGRGGPTSEGNGALLCGRHHRYIHAHGWTGLIVDGHVIWRPPDPTIPTSSSPTPGSKHSNAPSATSPTAGSPATPTSNQPTHPTPDSPARGHSSAGVPEGGRHPYM